MSLPFFPVATISFTLFELLQRKNFLLVVEK